MNNTDNKPVATKDNGAEPFKAQKDVILCRSGKQVYHCSEVEHLISKTNKPPVPKDFYVEYRPVNVVVDAQELCSSLPVTKEHPEGWVDGANFNELVGGTTDKEVRVVSLDGDSEGEVGLKTTLTFYSDELYDYYLHSNKEVSLGYISIRTFVDNPEDVGYDIIMEKIVMVNHLALTSNGRGGSSVAVIDSLIGGLKPMKTSLFAGLNIFSKKEKDFGKAVCDSVKKSKATTDEDLAKDMQGVLDSCATLKDSEAKTELLDAVNDSFKNKDLTLANEEEVTARLNAYFEKADAVTKDSSLDSKKGDENEIINGKTDDSKDKEEPTDDSEKKDDESKEEPTDDSEKKDDEPTDDSKEEPEDKSKDGCKDSEYVTKEELNAVKDSMIAEMKEMMGKMFAPEDNKPKGGNVDNGTKDSLPSASEMYGFKYSDIING